MKISVTSRESEVAAGDFAKPQVESLRIFLKGVTFLSVSTVITKIIGFIYKIPMLRFLGEEGMGYFNAAYEWFAFFGVLAASGLPVALSMQIASARAENREDKIPTIEKTAWLLFILIGITGSAVLFFGADLIAGFIGSMPTESAIRASAPAVLLSCLCASIRGYFQGYENMVPTATSQVIEALGKLLGGIFAGYCAGRLFLPIEKAAALAILGVSFGTALSLVYLLYERFKFQKKDTKVGNAVKYDFASEGKPLLRIAIPITLSAGILALSRVLDIAMVLRRLRSIGFDAAGANALYGGYTSMAVPIFNLVPSLLSVLSVALIPTLRTAIRRGDEEGQARAVGLSLRLTSLIALPATIALAFYSHTILNIVFLGKENVDTAAKLLTLLSFSVFFSASITTTNAILQAYHHTLFPVLTMLTGSLFKLLSGYLLIGIPSVNIFGAPISTFACDAFVAGINLWLISNRCLKLESLKEVLLKPLFVSLLSVGFPGILFAVLTRAGYSEISLFFVDVPLTVFLLLILSFGCNLLTVEQIKKIPLLQRGICLIRAGKIKISKEENANPEKEEI